MSSGGVAFFAFLGDGGMQNIYSGASAIGARFSGGTENIFSGAEINKPTLAAAHRMS